MPRQNESFGEFLVKMPWWVSASLGVLAFGALRWGLPRWAGQDNSPYISLSDAQAVNFLHGKELDDIAFVQPNLNQSAACQLTFRTPPWLNLLYALAPGDLPSQIIAAHALPHRPNCAGSIDYNSRGVIGSLSHPCTIG